MIITKVLQTSIDLFTDDDIYNQNMEAVLMKKLTSKYANICYMSMLITNIKKIIQYSDVTMVDNRLDGGAYINVKFEVEGIILVQGEVLHDCKVIETATTGTIIEHKYAGGLIYADPKRQAVKLIQKDQVISVIVEKARYNVNQKQISIRGIPYIPLPPLDVYYQITDILSPEDTDKVDYLLNQLNEELKLHEPIKNEKSYEFFRDLMYPFKTLQKFKETKIGDQFKPVEIDLKSILEIHGGCLTAPTAASKQISNSNFLYHSKSVPDSLLDKFTNQQSETLISKQRNILINSEMYSAISDIINRRILYLQALRGFVTQYDTQAKVMERMAYWRVCQSLKE